MNRFRMSGVKIMAVPHCLDERIPTILIPGDKAVIGTPVGWCPDSELGEFSRGTQYIGVRTFVQGHGEVWGHTLRQHLHHIFPEDRCS